MLKRVSPFIFSIAAALAFASCGDDAGSSDSTDPTTPEASETTPEVPAETTPIEPTDDEPDDAGNGGVEAETGCNEILTPEEVEPLLGTAPQFSGAGEVCQVIYADDAVGSFQAFSGSKADDAMGILLADFESNAASVADGVLLADGRGYVLGGNAAVRGDSGRVFVFNAPDNLGVDDLQAAMEGIADLLLTR